MKVKVRWIRIFQLLFLGIFLSITGPATLVSAHTSLISSNPTDGTTIETWPTNVTLTFGEDLQVISGKKINLVAVTNSMAEELSTGEVAVSGRTITVPVKENSTPGIVLVNYRVAAGDGHIVEGEFTFTYKKNSEVTPSSSLTAHPHNTNNNLPIFATSTILIVAALLFGLWSYRKE